MKFARFLLMVFFITGTAAGTFSFSYATEQNPSLKIEVEADLSHLLGGISYFEALTTGIRQLEEALLDLSSQSKEYVVDLVEKTISTLENFNLKLKPLSRVLHGFGELVRLEGQTGLAGTMASAAENLLSLANRISELVNSLNALLEHMQSDAPQSWPSEQVIAASHKCRDQLKKIREQSEWVIQVHFK